MVFESLVVELINRFLGDVIENLDKSQLSIGIWGGDVVLNNLFIKENLFNDLDLPLKVIYGSIGQLKLKIPWKNLYTDSTVAILDGLYIIAVPNTSIEYDAKKEEKSAWDSKMKILNKIEEAKKNESADPNSKKADDSFTEKLITNIIKNLEVKITNIHVRYEDNVTDPNKSFVVGVTLAELSCQTTDENWKAVIVKESTNIIFKLLKMENFSLYCNIGQPIYQKNDRNVIQQTLKSNIVSTPDQNKYQFVIEPMSLAGSLRLNMKPESDGFKTAKIFLNFLLENISIGLSKSQYQSLINFLDSYGRMQLASKFRKYRPQLDSKRNYIKWWKFAINCILCETVKRQKEMWQWNNMKKHRDICKKYKSLYKMKITNQKLTQDMIIELDTCERTLDILNITIARKQADIEAKKEGLMKPPDSGGWFSGWFGKGYSKSNEDKPTIEKMEELLTPEEKLKLYSAIGYQENSNAILPKEYVATKLIFKLDKIGIKLKDDSNKFSEVFNLHLNYLNCDIDQRPGADAIMVNGSLKSLIVTGQTSALSLNMGPTLISSEEEVSSDCQLLGFKFETNPIDGSCDQDLRLIAQSLRIVYDAQTIISLVSFLKPPDSLYLDKLQNDAMARMSKVSQNTVSGLQHALSKRKCLKVNVNIKPTYIIVPQTGFYAFNCRMLVLDLGILSVTTEERKTQSTQKLTLEELKNQAYDIFKLKVERIQVLLVNPDKDWGNWEENRTLGDSNIHILNPMNIDVAIQKCALEDAELPALRVLGVLPNISLQLSDTRIVEVLSLFESIPLPPSSPTQDYEELDHPVVAVDLSNHTIEEKPENISILDSDHKIVSKESINTYEKSNIEMIFEIKEVCVILSRFEKEVNIPILKFLVESLGCNLNMKLFDKDIHLYIGGIYLQHLAFKASKDLKKWYQMDSANSNGPLVNLINTLTVDDHDIKLLDINITLADRKHPDLITRFNNCLQKLSIVLSDIEILLHQEALLDIMLYLNNIEKLKNMNGKPASNLVRQLSKSSIHTLSSSIKKLDNKKVKSKKRSMKQELIDLMILSKLEKLSIGICTQQRLIVDIKIEEMSANVTLQPSLTSVEINLKELNMFDRHHDAVYSQILSFTGSHVFNICIIIYNKITEEELNCSTDLHHLSVKFETGQMKFVFLNLFVQQLLSFLNNFETAKKSFQETQLVASKKAIAAAENVQANTMRLKLDIKIRAPLILVPEQSKSNVVISLDLGEILISNIFKISQINNKPIVLDLISLQLEQLKISRMIVIDNVTKAECLMLDPISLNIIIVRNLSTKSYPQQPDIEITANMNNISMAISKSELATLLNVLDKNLNEKDLNLSLPESDVNIVPIEQLSLDNPLATIHEGSEIDIEEARCTFKLTFKLSNICLHLFHSDKMIVIGDANCHEPDTSFAKIELKNINSLVSMKSDKSMSADFILASIKLRDSRPNREECITELITQNGSSENNELITLYFIQDMKLNKEVKLCIDELRIILFMEFLLKLSQFMPSKDENNEPVKIESKQPKRQISKSIEMNHREEVAPASDLKVKFSMLKPQILFIENPQNPHCDALLLEMEVDFTMQSSQFLQSIKANVHGISIVTCICSDLLKNRAQILNPVDIDIQSSAPFGKNHHACITMSDIDLNISPSSLRILMSTLSALSIKKEESIDDILGRIPKDLWAPKKLNEDSFWFLKLDETDKLNFENSSLVKSIDDRGEQLIFSNTIIRISFLGNGANKLVPLVFIEISLTNIDIKDWTSKLSMFGDVSIQVAYFNDFLACWEPVLEPVETEAKPKPWQLQITLTKNGSSSPNSSGDGVDISTIASPPIFIINIISDDFLNITITKKFLELVEDLGKSFSDAYLLVTPRFIDMEIQAPYDVHNYTGSHVTIKIDENLFKCEQQPSGEKNEYGLESGKSIQLYDTYTPKELLRRRSSSSYINFENIYSKKQLVNTKSLIAIFSEMGSFRQINMSQSEKRGYEMIHTSAGGLSWNIITRIEANLGFVNLTLTSNLKVKNCMNLAIEVFYELCDESLAICGKVEPKETIYMPCDAAYSSPFKLYFKPIGGRFRETIEGFYWLQNNMSYSLLECPSIDKTKQNIYISPLVNTDYVLYESTNEKTIQTFEVVLNSSIVLRNLLPNDICCIVESDEALKIEAGHKLAIPTINPGKTMLTISFFYGGRDWVGMQCVDVSSESLLTWCFHSINEDGEKITMDLGLHSDTSEGNIFLSLYSPYWIINMTNKDLYYNSPDQKIIKHDANNKNIVFFLFKKSLNGNQRKACLRIGESDWSEKFSLDTVGSNGIVSCKIQGNNISKNENSKHVVGVKITLSSIGLTRIVTFTPYYILINLAKFKIDVKEHLPNSQWQSIAANSCLPLYLNQPMDRKQLVCRIDGSAIETQPFDIHETHNTLLKLYHDYGGISVEVNVIESATTITLKQYEVGSATVLIINNTDFNVQYKQNELGEEYEELNCQSCVYFTWTKPIAKREFILSCNHKTVTFDLIKDDCNELFLDSDTKLYWVSFLDGMQRVLFITQDLLLARNCQQVGDFEQVDKEILISFNGVGISLVNNAIGKEIVFMGINSSGVIWQCKKKSKYKPMKVRYSETIENAYQMFLLEQQVEKKIDSKKKKVPTATLR